MLTLFYANSEPQPNAKYSCAASVAIASCRPHPNVGRPDVASFTIAEKNP
ncbi:hypothetical protein ACTQ3A_02140 [Bilifractor sp. LCP21S3_F8]